MLTYKKLKPKEKDGLAKLEEKLEDVFSLYIRLLYSDAYGYCKCFTCGSVWHFTAMDCGHGIKRQHNATKFLETNNHPQCRACNRNEGGLPEIYKQKVNEKYGSGTWEKMEIEAKQECKFSADLLKNNIDYYTEQVKILKEEKGMV